MAQFEVYENNDPDTQELYPYLLDVQADLLGELPTRIVVPLVKASAIHKPIPVLHPAWTIDQTQVIMQTPQLAAISRNLLGTRICSLESMRNQIIAALDLAFTGF